MCFKNLVFLIVGLLNSVSTGFLNFHPSRRPPLFITTPVSSSAPESLPSTRLRLVAGVPIEKEEEKKKDRQRDDAEDWIMSDDGGFIPNLKSRLKVGHTTVSPITEVTDIQAYKDEVADERSRMVCVRFYAPWCKACKAVESRFRSLPRDFPNVKFVEVPLTQDNGYLHNGLGVPSLPFAHLYHPEVGLVEERKINKNVFNEFKKILKTYVDGECPVEDIINGNQAEIREDSDDELD